MKSLFLIPVILVAILTAARGQADNKHVIRAEAQKYATAMEHADIETLITFTYPGVIEKFGGKREMMAMMKGRMNDMKASGAVFEPTLLGQPSNTVKAGSETHCLISQTQTIKGPSGKSKMESTLLAVTKDNGSHWYFISLETYTQQSIKILLPNYNPELKVPAKKPPQFIAN